MKKDFSVSDGFSLKGEVKWIKTKPAPAWVRALGIEDIYFTLVPRKVLAESPWMPNQIMANDDRGVYMILDRLCNITTYTGVIGYAEIGDDNTTPASSDTALGNGLVRVQVGSYSRSSNQATFRFFFPDATTPDDTYLEFGMYVDGSITVDSGQLFNHLLFSTDLVKSTGEDHTVVCRITGSV